MAGFYETLMAYQKKLPSASSYAAPVTNSVFGNAETTPSLVATSNENIKNLQNSVDQARQNVANAQQAYKGLQSSKPQQYKFNNIVYYDDRSGSYRVRGYENPTYTSWQNQLNDQQKKLNAAQTTLKENQTALQEAIAQQKANTAAGKDAVTWGLTAKNAEAQGLKNAMQAYQQTMANEGMRNAIMNAAIGTVGNFGGGGK